MNCQVPECTNIAVWREIDYYKQQGQEFTYFYYFCGKHKENAEKKKTAGHNKVFYRLNSIDIT